MTAGNGRTYDPHLKPNAQVEKLEMRLRWTAIFGSQRTRNTSSDWWSDA
ncbi:MAG: hypothetical protein ACKO2N_01430 [Tabrizicola sp.]